ncbi:heterokaryon incompatibility protein-domain-containing protein, partial [Macrophomina phaseolina]
SNHLIELLPGTGDEEIRCKLNVARTRPSQPYEATLYSWGDPKDRRKVICNGRVLRITRNLRNSLRYLRFPKKFRVLWADAICISQQDLKERGHQVMQMGAIFPRGSTSAYASLKKK